MVFGRKRWVPAVVVGLGLLVAGFLGVTASAQAAEARLSDPEESPGIVQLSGVWAAWDDYSVDPGVVRWVNLESGAKGAVEVPGLDGGDGTLWGIGDGFLCWDAWVDGADAGLYVEDLVTHQRRQAAPPQEQSISFAVKGGQLFWIEEGVLHRVNEKTGAASTFELPKREWGSFDADGDRLVWADFGDSPSDSGATGTIHLLDLTSGRDSVLGKVLWGNLADWPPQVTVSGHWVVWNTDKSAKEWQISSAFLYDLDTKTVTGLSERMGPEQSPEDLHVSGDWLMWTDIGTTNVRAYVMDLADKTGAPIPVAKTPGWQFGGGILPPWLVWQDDRNSAGDYGVYARPVNDPPAVAFTDIADSPYKRAIEYLAAANVIEGAGDGTFSPTQPVLRAQFAKMIDVTLGLDVYEGETPLPFTDVEQPEDDLYPDDYVAVAAANGLVKGFGGGLFKPYDPISRAQVLTMIVRAAEKLNPSAIADPPQGFEKIGLLDYSDPIHGPKVEKAEYNGLLDGIDLHGFDLHGTATRGEIAQVLYNLMNDNLRADLIRFVRFGQWGPTTYKAFVVQLGFRFDADSLKVVDERSSHLQLSFTIDGYRFKLEAGTGVDPAKPAVEPDQDGRFASHWAGRADDLQVVLKTLSDKAQVHSR